jgi:hypothetical protein
MLQTKTVDELLQGCAAAQAIALHECAVQSGARSPQFRPRFDTGAVTSMIM